MAEKEIFVTALTDVKTTDVEGVGTIRKDDKGNFYRWVKNVDTAGTIAANSAVCYENFVDFETIVTPATANLPNFAGRAVTALPYSNYGWVQIKGIGTMTLVSGATIAANVPLIASNAVYGLATAAVATNAVNPYYYNMAILAASVASTATSGTVLIKCY